MNEGSLNVRLLTCLWPGVQSNPLVEPLLAIITPPLLFKFLYSSVLSTPPMIITIFAMYFYYGDPEVFCWEPVHIDRRLCALKSQGCRTLNDHFIKGQPHEKFSLCSRAACGFLTAHTVTSSSYRALPC